MQQLAKTNKKNVFLGGLNYRPRQRKPIAFMVHRTPTGPVAKPEVPEEASDRDTSVWMRKNSNVTPAVWGVGRRVEMGARWGRVGRLFHGKFGRF